MIVTFTSLHFGVWCPSALDAMFSLVTFDLVLCSQRRGLVVSLLFLPHSVRALSMWYFISHICLTLFSAWCPEQDVKLLPCLVCSVGTFFFVKLLFVSLVCACVVQFFFVNPPLTLGVVRLPPSSGPGVCDDSTARDHFPLSCRSTASALVQRALTGMAARWECNDRASATRQTSKNKISNEGGTTRPLLCCR